MKKIMNGKKYDTDTAKKIAQWSNEEWGGLFFVIETLYRKKTGEYFLLGEGGAGTVYSVPTAGGGFAGSAQIIPLSLDASREWAVTRLDADEYESIFGPCKE